MCSEDTVKKTPVEGKNGLYDIEIEYKNDTRENNDHERLLSLIEISEILKEPINNSKIKK